MSTSATMTEDASQFDGWSRWKDGTAGHALLPRLRLLYHVDPERIGAIATLPRLEQRNVVGRREPLFFHPREGTERPIDDPKISREQLEIRWDGEAFIVRNLGRRAVALLDLNTGALDALQGERAVPPHTCLAIGDRALLVLELGRPRGAGEDRLGLLGESEAMWAVRDAVLRVARFREPALITGPTGAGKELVARAVHARSGRADGPLIAVNCANLSPSLVESTLFGHRRGAFTGADAPAPGLFRAADGGTLVLDEFGELPLEVQPKLLREQQDGLVTPVGGHAAHPVDVRVIASTNRRLDAEVQAGRMRADLYFRVNSHVVEVPSLDERRFDVPALFVHFLSALRDEHPELGWLWGDGFRPGLPIGFFAALLGRSWPGNVRELKNVATTAAQLNLEVGTFRAPDGLLSVEQPAATPPPGVELASEEGDALASRASRRLGLARRTVRKVIGPPALAAFFAEADDAGWTPEEEVTRLRTLGADSLFALLEAHDFNRSHLAGALSSSRTTVLKLMTDFGLPRIDDLELAQIETARAEAAGDLEAAARALRVSPRALRKRLTILKMKQRA